MPTALMRIAVQGTRFSLFLKAWTTIMEHRRDRARRAVFLGANDEAAS
jgi:hypothetical protein